MASSGAATFAALREHLAAWLIEKQERRMFDFQSQVAPPRAMAELTRALRSSKGPKVLLNTFEQLKIEHMGRMSKCVVKS